MSQEKSEYSHPYPHELGEIRLIETFKPTERTLKELHRYFIRGQDWGILGLSTGGSVERFTFDPIQNKGVWKPLRFNVENWEYEE